MKYHLPVHIVLGANEYAQIRTSVPMRVGHSGEPIAEFACFGWAIMAPGVETDLSAGFLAVDGIQDYEVLCSLNVLGIADAQEVHREVREQLSRNTEEAWYEAGVPRKRRSSPTRIELQVQSSPLTHSSSAVSSS